jgi:NMD protein affecting ribosome stability and mRNA decay
VRDHKTIMRKWYPQFCVDCGDKMRVSDPDEIALCQHCVFDRGQAAAREAREAEHSCEQAAAAFIARRRGDMGP